LGIVVIMVDGFDLQAIGLVAPEIARSWSLDIAQFGPAFGGALLGSIGGAMAAGPAARQFGLRAVLTSSLFLFGSTTLASAFAANLHSLTVLRLVAGVGLGAAIPIVTTLIASASAPQWRATLVVMALCGQPIGAIAGASLCARFIPLYGWPFAFHLGGILPLLLGGACLLFPGISAQSAPTPASPASPPAQLSDLFRGGLRKATLLLWTCEFFAIFFVYIIVNWLPAFARGAGYSLQSSILAISAFNLGGIVGALTLGTLMDRRQPLRVAAAAFGCAAGSVALLEMASPVALALLGVCFVTGLSGYGGAIASLSLPVLLYPPSLRTAGVGWLLGMGRIGAAIGPVGAGAALAAGLGIGRLFLFSAAAALLAGTCCWLLDRAAGLDR
jgi:MFS transporter, AAHS family, 4-hydroxybenzoate transporter